jgi:glyoxylase-like metal-dependent hydrolase (beta-lactamase superfamily II)
MIDHQPDPTDLARLGITALSPGLWRIALPFPTPLGYSFSYLLRFGDAFIAVDLGWDDDHGWDLFTSGLARAGGSLDQLRGVVITHAHPDHYGMAPRVHRESSAWIALHPAEHPQIATSDAARRRRVTELELWLAKCGVPASATDELLSDRPQLTRNLSSQVPDIELADQATIAATDGQLVAIHTPGHTPGHVVFFDRARNVLFTGGHLLPRVSVNISDRPTSGADPLGHYQASLGLLAPYDAALAAPGHEWSFDRIGERREAVARHHRDRLAEIEKVVEEGYATTWEVANVVTWSRPFESLNPRGKRSALGETAAHLGRLAIEQRISRRDGTPTRWARR